MKFLLLVLALPVWAFAQSNSYSWQKDVNKTSAELLLGRSTGSITMPLESDFYGYDRVSTRDVQSMDYHLNLMSNYEDYLKFQFGILFQDKKVTDRSGNYNVAGFSNLNANVWTTKAFETSTLIYGLDTSLSLAPLSIENTIDKDGNANDRLANNYSGYHSFSPFVASEFIIGRVTSGVKGSYTRYESRMKNSGAYGTISTDGKPMANSRDGLNLDIYAEFDMHKQYKVGLSAGESTAKIAAGDLISGSSDNSYRSQIYGRYEHDAETEIFLGLTSENSKIYYERQNSEVNLGLKRNL